MKNSDDVWAASQAVFAFNDGSGIIRGLPPEFYHREPIKIFGHNFGSIPRRPFTLLVYE